MPAEAVAGESVEVLGDGFAPNGTVRVVLRTGDGDRPVAEAVADDDGHVAVAAVLPDDLGTRYYEVRADGADGATASGSVSVTAAEDGEPWLVPVLAAGVTALAVALVLGVARRRPAGRSTVDRR